MLDFYYIYDDAPTPEYPNEDQFLGGLDLDEFQRVSELVDFVNSLGINMEFFTDFRLKSHAAQKALRVAENSISECEGKTKDAYGKLYQILSEAVSQSAGIISFSD